MLPNPSDSPRQKQRIGYLHFKGETSAHAALREYDDDPHYRGQRIKLQPAKTKKGDSDEEMKEHLVNAEKAKSTGKPDFARKRLLFSHSLIYRTFVNLASN